MTLPGARTRFILTLSNLQIMTGLLSMLLGCLMLYFSWDNRGGPITTATPIWCGFWVVIAGIVGRQAASVDQKEKYCSWFQRQYPFFEVVAVIYSCINLGHIIWLLVTCLAPDAATKYRYCFPNYTAVLAVAGLNLATGLAMLVQSVVASFLSFRTCKK